MPPILSTPPNPLTLTPEPLTPTSFSPYGTAIVSPLPRDLSAVPSPLSDSLKLSRGSYSSQTPAPVLANQGTALKYSPVSPLLDEYTGQCPSGRPAEGRMSMFCCFPRGLRRVSGSGSGPGDKATEVFDVRILERHPFTTQTFIPINLSGDPGGQEPIFLVIVAPTLKGEVAIATTTTTTKDGKETTSTTTIRDPPDLNNLKAFIATGGQAVTYAPGTWHAPMVVLGSRRVDFVVVQFVNGVDDEDCQEVAFGEGVVVDCGCGGGGVEGLTRAKL